MPHAMILEVWIGVATAVLAGLMILTSCAGTADRPGRHSWVTFGFFGYIALGLGAYYLSGFLVPDESTYHHAAIETATNFQNGVLSVDFSEGKEGWVWVLGTLYYVGGVHPELGYVFNAFAIVLAGILISDVCHDMNLGGSSRYGLPLALLPVPFLAWGTLLLREALIIAVLAGLLRSFVRYRERKRISHILGVCVWTLALGLFRLSAVPLATIGLVMGIACAALFGKTRGQLLRRIVASAVLITAAIVIVWWSTELGWTAERADVVRSATARDASSAIEGVSDRASLSGILTSLPHVALGPFPWEWNATPVGLLTAVDAVWWWLFVCLVVAGSLRFTDDRWLLLVPAILFVVSVTLTTGSYGSAVRYRAMAIPFLVPLAAVGFMRFRTWVGSRVSIRSRTDVNSVLNRTR